MDKDAIVINIEEGEKVEFYPIEQTKLNGKTYLLVADSKEGDAECLVLRDDSKAEDKDSLYEIVDDDVELQAVMKVFEELLEDTDIEM